MPAQPRNVTRGWAVLPLRLVVGYGFFAHGLAKLIRGPAGFAKLLLLLHIPLPAVTAWMVTLLEIVGGIALIAGLLVPLISIPLGISMLVAMFTVHVRYGFSAVNTVAVSATGPQFGPPGYEINLLYIAALIAVAAAGPGTPSIHDWWQSRKKPSQLPTSDGPGSSSRQSTLHVRSEQ